MILNFNYKNKILLINNFLNENEYRYIYHYIIKNRNKNLKSTFVTWNQLNNPNSIYDFDINIINKYEILLKHQKFVDFKNFSFKSHFRKYSYMHSLDWHNDYDEKRKYAATLYLNKNWNKNWGGELMFQDNNIRGFIPILGNSLLIIKVGINHKVNSVLRKKYQ